MVLIDKGYYDYDFEARKVAQKVDTKPKTQNEVASMLARFGFKTKIKGTEPTKPLTPEEAQRIVMEEIKAKPRG